MCMPLLSASCRCQCQNTASARIRLTSDVQREPPHRHIVHRYPQPLTAARRSLRADQHWFRVPLPQKTAREEKRESRDKRHDRDSRDNGTAEENGADRKHCKHRNKKRRVRRRMARSGNPKVAKEQRTGRQQMQGCQKYPQDTGTQILVLFNTSCAIQPPLLERRAPPLQNPPRPFVSTPPLSTPLFGLFSPRRAVRTTRTLLRFPGCDLTKSRHL
jgi:hypothetical protein